MTLATEALNPLRKSNRTPDGRRLPPELPPAPPGPALPLPMQYCEDCHLAFRATDVDDCPGCARK